MNRIFSVMRETKIKMLLLLYVNHCVGFHCRYFYKIVHIESIDSVVELSYSHAALPIQSIKCVAFKIDQIENILLFIHLKSIQTWMIHFKLNSIL